MIKVSSFSLSLAVSVISTAVVQFVLWMNGGFSRHVLSKGTARSAKSLTIAIVRLRCYRCFGFKRVVVGLRGASGLLRLAELGTVFVKGLLGVRRPMSLFMAKGVTVVKVALVKCEVKCVGFQALNLQASSSSNSALEVTEACST
jgi:hypothetical protein